MNIGSFTVRVTRRQQREVQAIAGEVITDVTLTCEMNDALAGTICGTLELHWLGTQQPDLGTVYRVTFTRVDAQGRPLWADEWPCDALDDARETTPLPVVPAAPAKAE